MSYSFGANAVILDLGADFELVGASPVGGKETTNSVSRNRKGNYIPATNQQRNEVQNIVLTFRAINPDGATAEIVLGGVGGSSVHVPTRVAVKQTNTGDASVEVTLHKNAGNNNLHLDQEYTIEIPVSGYGITANPLTGGVLKDNCIAMEWVAEVQHVDKQNRVGDHLVGFSHGCLITCTQTYVDDEAAINAAADWFIDSDVPSEASEDTRSRVVRGHTFQAADV